MSKIDIGSHLVYQNKISNHSQVVDDFKDIINNDKYFNFNKHWDCIVETTRDYEKWDELPWNNFLNEVADNHLIPFIKKYAKPRIEFSVSLKGVWMNRYKKFAYQENHNHIGKGHHFSCNYILKTAKGAGDFKLSNTNYNNLAASGVSDIINPESQFWTADNEEGNLVIFPSYLDHHVTPNLTDDLRVTISANFEIVDSRGIFIG